MKRDDCPVCGRQDFKDEISIRYIDVLNGMGDEEYLMDVVSCPYCGMVWVRNPFDVDVMSNYYKYMSKYEKENIIKEDVSKERMISRQASFINRNIDKYESIIEVGASTGESLAFYKSCGKTVFGIEPSETNRIYADRVYNVELYSGTLDEYFDSYCNSGVPKFDLVYMSNVLEHLTDVQGAIKKAAQLSQNYIFIEIPILDSMGAREEAYGVFFHEHVNYFTIRSFMYLMVNLVGGMMVAGSIDFNMNGESPGFPTMMSLWKLKKSDMGGGKL